MQVAVAVAESGPQADTLPVHFNR